MSAPTGTPPIDIRFEGRLGAFSLDVAFAIPASGVTGLFGPSGSGKTSILRAMAGLARLEGHLRIGSEVWQDASRFVPTHRRPLGYVFQEASLFPHLSVRANLLYGAKRAGTPTSGRELDTLIELLGLSRLLARDPSNLSGGERQRVALGRALLTLPRLLLMDEPLSALDRDARNEILPYLERLHAELSIPVVYVSHDLAEIERLADWLVLVRDGRVTASGPLNDLLTDPVLGLSRRSDAASVLAGTLIGHDVEDGLSEIDIGGASLFLGGATAAEMGGRRRLRIEASDVGLSLAPPEGSTVLNVLPVRILRIDPAGEADMAVLLNTRTDPPQRLVAKVTRRSVRRLALAAGQSIYAQVKSVSLATSRGRGTKLDHSIDEE